MSFHIVADSCCELTADMKKRENIEIAPLTLEVGGESILDDETFDQKSFSKKSSGMPGMPEIRMPVSGVFPHGISERSKALLCGNAFRTAQRIL